MAWGLADLVAAAQLWGPGKSVNISLSIKQRGKNRAFALTLAPDSLHLLLLTHL